MWSIWVIAKNTFREILRDRVLYVLLIFAVLFMGLCFAIGQLSYDEIFRLSLSLGLSGIHLSFCVLTIFLGSSLFYREIERRTIYTMLARPLSRGQYLVGKYIGLMGVLSALLLGFVLCFTVVELLLGIPILWTTYFSFFGFLLESFLLLSVTFFFSTFFKPFMAISMTFSFFLIGHWVDSLKYLAEKSESDIFNIFSQIILRTFPHLEVLNWRPQAISKSIVQSIDFNFAIYTTFSWSLLFLFLSIMIFRRKDFA